METVELKETTGTQAINKSANILYKDYKKTGGTLTFKNFIQREKTKGVFPLNVALNEEVEEAYKQYKNSKVMSDKKILGLPQKTVLIAAGVIIVAVLVYKYAK